MPEKDDMPLIAPYNSSHRDIVWGIVGTGQSLGVGQHATGTAYTPVVATAGAGHYKLWGIESYSASEGEFPYATHSSTWQLAPLSEPLRIDPPTSPWWPNNVVGQSPHTPIAARLNTLSGHTIQTAHICAGHNGYPYSYIRKGGEAVSYAAAILEAQRMQTLFAAMGKTLRFAAVVLTHGENDYDSDTYEADILQLADDSDADLRAITGQSQRVMMIASQPSAGYPLYGPLKSAQAMLDAYLHHPDKVLLSGPKIGLEYWPDDFHLTAQGTADMGATYGDAVYSLITGGSFSPLYPLSVTRSGSVVTVTLNRPAAFDASLWGTTHTTGAYAPWANGRGFEAVDAGGTPIAISSVTIAGAVVTITCASAPSKVFHATYADSNAIRRGQVRDSAGNWLVQFTRSTP